MELGLYGNAIFIQYTYIHMIHPASQPLGLSYTEEIRSDMQEIWSRLLYRTILLYGIGYYVNESCL